MLNKIIVSFVKLLPESIVYIFAKKYIAGPNLTDAVSVTKKLNSMGIAVTIDVLGEAIRNKEEAVYEKNECLRVLEIIKQEKLNANLSVKPTSLGLSIDKEFFLTQMKELLNKAKQYNNFIRMDMEDSRYTTLTIEAFKKLQTEFNNVGIVLQAYLKRTSDDVDELNKTKSNYRLCKGIYVEPEEIAYKEKQKIRQNYLMLLEKMLKNKSYVAVATHDDYLITNAYKLIEKMNIKKDLYEFQMLYGVKEKLRDKINKDGHKIRIYVPYGQHWHAYSIRRMQENPQIAMHITKSIFKFS